MQYQAELSRCLVLDPPDQALEAAGGLPVENGHNPMRTIVLDIPADLAYVHLLSRCACAFLENIPNLEEPETSLYNLELAIQEVGVNIVKHAYHQMNGRIHMTLLLAEDPLRLTITMQDTGRSFDPAQVPQPKLGELQEHGFGLFLVRQLMDTVAYEHNTAGNTWTLIKKIPLTET